MKPAARPLAFLSDVHGNLTALEAVMQVLADRGVVDVFVAGDLLYGGDESLEVWQRLQRASAQCTRGLSDTALFMVDPDALRPADAHEQSMAERFVSTRRALGDLVIEQLRRLPERLRVPMLDGNEILMVHGSPLDSSQEISHDMGDDEIATLLNDDPATLVVCGGSHVPFQRRVGAHHVVNVGSVGAAPEGSVAHYTIITPRMDGAEVAQDFVQFG